MWMALTSRGGVGPKSNFPSVHLQLFARLLSAAELCASALTPCPLTIPFTLQMDPEPFYSMCTHDTCQSQELKAACSLAAAFVHLCKRNFVPVEIPPQW